MPDPVHQQGFTNAELNRRLNNLITVGTIAELDHAGKRLRVDVGENKTTWLPWPADVGKNYRRWRPLRTQQQLILASTTGDLAQALIIGMLYSDNITAPSSDDTVDLIEFNDGSTIEYNSESHVLTIDVKGTLRFKADKHEIIGPVKQEGGDITSDNVSVQHHPHKDVVPGKGKSGEPIAT